MKVKIKLLHERAKMPTKAHDLDAGFDLTAITKGVDDFGNFVYGTGIAVRIPDNNVGLIFQRSSVSKKNMILTNAVGVIDAGYIGEITFKFKPLAHAVHTSAKPYDIGERIGQLIILPIPSIEFELSDDLGDSDRGTGNYGSSGK